MTHEFNVNYVMILHTTADTNMGFFESLTNTFGDVNSMFYTLGSLLRQFEENKKNFWLEIFDMYHKKSFEYSNKSEDIISEIKEDFNYCYSFRLLDKTYNGWED